MEHEVEARQHRRPEALGLLPRQALQQRQVRRGVATAVPPPLFTTLWSR